MPSTLTPNMDLIVPTVGTQPGPDYADNLNADLSLIDGHDHTSGKGVPIPAAAIDINGDLSINQHNLYDIRSTRYSPISLGSLTGSDLDCLIVSGVDLYYVDGNGNQVRITQSGSVVGTPGSITGLTPPASATYVAGSQTFIWESAVNTAAHMDFASAILRNPTLNSFGLTLEAPTLSADYSIVLPALPASQKIMTLDASGNMTAPYVVDNSTIEINSNTIRVKAEGIGTNEIADGAVTAIKLAASLTALPAYTKYTSGSGTYTTPAGCTYLVVEMVGGGGGGAGGGQVNTSATAGADGGDTTFSDGGSISLSANKGAGGDTAAASGGVQSAGGAGGGTSVSGVTAVYNIAGGNGGGGSYNAGAVFGPSGGMGASGPNGGAGGGGTGYNSSPTAGGIAVANSGSGGGGGGALNTASSVGGGGGGAGGYIKAYIPAPSASFSYVVGGAGANGSAGTNGQTGGNGGSGYIFITAYSN